MPEVLYQLRVVQAGKYVSEFLAENKLILFAAPVPADIADYSVVHQPGELVGELMPGQTLTINQQSYPVTAVGDVASVNLRQLGHITLNFDGAEEAELPGMVHLAGERPAAIHTGDVFVLRVSVSSALAL